MNELIKNQLKNLKIAQLPFFDDDTTQIIITKNVPLFLQENNYYLIELEDSLLNPSFNPVLVTNWNAGSVPLYKYYKVNVIKVMGQMVKVNGVAFDYQNGRDIDSFWTGWLILNKIKIINKI